MRRSDVKRALGSMALLATLVAFGACASAAAAPPETGQPLAPYILFVRTEVQDFGFEGDSDPRAMDLLDMVNDTDAEFEYSYTLPGVDAGYPEVRVDGEWRPIVTYLVCSWGIFTERINPGETVRLTTDCVGDLARYQVHLRNVMTGEIVVASSGPYLSGSGVDWSVVPKPSIEQLSGVGDADPSEPRLILVTRQQSSDRP